MQQTWLERQIFLFCCCCGCVVSRQRISRTQISSYKESTCLNEKMIVQDLLCLPLGATKHTTAT